jgi:hypothetical protein
MFKFKLAALVIGLATPLVAFAGGMAVWKGVTDTKIDGMSRQIESLQKDVNWLIRHQPNGEEYLRQHNKSADDQFDMMYPPPRPQTAHDIPTAP